jgi:hypothetical protein
MPKRLNLLVSDTENEENECDASRFEKCSHFTEDEDVFIGGYMDAETGFKLQKIADNFYEQDTSKEAHTGNRTKTLKDIISASYKLAKNNGDIHSAGEEDSVLQNRILSGNYKGEDAVSKNRYEQLKQKMENERRKRKKLEERLERVKTRHEITDDTELQNTILETVQENPKTFDEIVKELKDSGLDIQQYNHPKVQGEYQASMSDVADFLINHLVDIGKLEVKNTDDGAVYRA